MSHRRPVRSLAALAITALSLAALTACNDDDASGDSSAAGDATSSSAPTTTSSTTTDAPSAAGAPEVTVLDAGADPQQELLLDVTEGQVETTRMKMTIGSSLPGSGSFEIPLSLTFVTTVDEVSDDAITLSYSYEDISAKLPPGAGSAQGQMDDTFDALEGITGTAEVTPSGAVVSTEFDVPDDAPPTVSSMLDQLEGQTAQIAVPFPSEPVGEGASWQVTSHLDLSQASTDQTSTYTLDSLDGEDYSISVEVDQDLDGGASGGSLSGHTTVSGSYDGTLHSFTATSGSLSGGGTATIDMGGQQAKVQTTIDMDISTEVE